MEDNKKCFNHCPKCDATDPNIEWHCKDWGDTTAWQNATCNKCGCEFTEVYEYVYSEIDAPVDITLDSQESPPVQ